VLTATEPPDTGLAIEPKRGRPVLVEAAVADEAIVIERAVAFGANAFRVLVPPGSTTTRRGPYRWIDHPNYVAVAGELIGIALAMHAVVTAVPVVGGFVYLMRRRVAVEEKALARR